MAGRAELVRQGEVQPLAEGPQPQTAAIEIDEVQLAAARLYGSGYDRRAIMRILLDHLAPKVREGKRDRTREEQESLARNKLRRWERSPRFRDLLYEHAVVELDLQTPDILKGVAKKARQGRVDAARFALEVTGRHNPRGDQSPPEITVNIANIPRPE